MPINLKAVIEEGSAIKFGGFTGAIFLTYTLNLGFFEQIILPALERAGCSNVLIISDPDGYVDAIETGAKKVSFAGLRYVCTPLPRGGFGVQHAKMLLMVGPQRGRLLIGSGNLTYYGYSRNLEVFTSFEYDQNEPDEEVQIAFTAAWNLIEQIKQEGLLTSTAQAQLEIIPEKAKWLNNRYLENTNFAVWHNHDYSIWSQFIGWRERNGLMGIPCKELKIFSPYYDQNIEMLRKFQNYLLPDHLNIYLSKENTTLNNQAFIGSISEEFDPPVVFNTKGASTKQANRLLHAKVIVGVEETGSWCIAGSANMTRPAFDKSWNNGSNLELVVFRWSSDPNTFNYLLDDSISIEKIDLESITPATDSDFSEEPRKVFQDSILIEELIINNKIIKGSLNHWPSNESPIVNIKFLKSGERISVALDEKYCFKLLYEKELSVCEAIIVEGEKNSSLPRWIDNPDSLRAYGSRSYRVGIQSKLDTVLGAELLFHELLDFLFDRVSPDRITQISMTRRSSKQEKNEDNKNSKISEPVPDSARFIVPETDDNGNYIIDQYTTHPYENNIHSLRDLLSIVLLKLTDLPKLSTEQRYDDDGNDENEINGKNQDDEEKNYVQDQINARIRLCKFLTDYCKKYSQKLSQKEFIEDIHPEFLLDNHLTLSRILLEFNEKVEEFNQTDLEKCYWLIWAPLFWPNIVSVDGMSTWEIYKNKNYSQELISSWDELNVTENFIAMTSTAFGQPPSWSVGLHSKELTKRFLTLNKLVEKYISFLNIQVNEFGKLDDIGLSHNDWGIIVNNFNKISDYLSPARERLSPIFNWIKYQDNPVLSKKYAEEILENNLKGEFYAYRDNPKKIKEIITEPDDEGNVYCPGCWGALREKSVSEINKGKLVLCSTNADVWLYKGEKLPTKLL